MAAYKSYRLYMTRNSSSSQSTEQGYFAVSEWRMYASEDASSPNLLVGGVASASHTSGSSYVPANAFDDNEGTTWESTSSPSGPKWLRYDLPEPVEARSIYVSHNTWSNERPRDFIVQGSNDDGETWDDLAVMTDFLLNSGPAGRTASIVRNIAGRSILDDGAPALLVRIHDWNSGELITQLTPDTEGYWETSILKSVDLMVIHIPPEGYRPLVDGPISLKPKW